MNTDHDVPVHTTGVLGRLADTMYVHRKKVIFGWLAALVLAFVASSNLGGTFTADYNTPGSDSEAASKRLEQKFAGRSGDAIDIVWQSADGAETPATVARIDSLLEEAGTVPGVVRGTTTRDAEVSTDGRTAIVRLPLDRPAGAVEISSAERIADLVKDASGEGLQVAANGDIDGLTPEAGMSSELIGLGVAAVVLLLTFGTVVAAGLPLISAVFGVGIAVLLGEVLAKLIDTPDWATTVSLMIGLGVGIDYALLVLTRYRAAVHRGLNRRQANVEAMTTAGESVLVAGATVVIALMGLFLMRLPYLNGVALAASLTVLTVMAATATLLPAIIGLAGRRIDSLQLGRLGRVSKDPDNTPSSRWARAVDRRPVMTVLAALGVLALLATPLLGIRFGLPDAGNNAESTTTRQAYDMVAEGFGPGANGPLIAVVTTDSAGDDAAVSELSTQISNTPGVVDVSPAQYNEARDTALIAITPSGAPSSSSTNDLVKRLRSDVFADSTVNVDLGGQTAAAVDQANTTAGRLPLFIGAVVGLSFLLLLGAFRAPIIALKAGVMTVLSIVASYGVVSLVAEGGWVGQLVGIDSDLPVPPFIPVMMFAVLFGLSMDYEVFLVSRIKEERERLGDARAGVMTGLARTSKVIMAAAMIMVSVFGAFALSSDIILKLIGVGLASAILIDAVVVRMCLVPAFMRLLGERAWWTPGRRSPSPSHLETDREPVPVVEAGRV
jgi:RND superfamily putative drug exporter